MILTIVLFVIAFIFFVTNVFLLFQFGKKGKNKALVCYAISMLLTIIGMYRIMKLQTLYQNREEIKTETIIREGKHER